MAFLPTHDPKEIYRYHRVMAQSVQLRSHQDVLVWLQGDMQRCVTQDILVAAWGNFSTGEIQHDVVSAIRGVRTQHSNPLTLKPMLMRFFFALGRVGKKDISVDRWCVRFPVGEPRRKLRIG